MSTRFHGSYSEEHQRSAELHDRAAHAHLSAAEAHEKQDHQTGQERSRQALEHSRQAHEHSEHAHWKFVNEHGIPTFVHEDIAVLAYQLWQDRGCPEGSPEADWFQAARNLRARAGAREE